MKVDATVRVTGARESLLAKLERMAGGHVVDPELGLHDDVPQADTAARAAANRQYGDKLAATSSPED